MAATSQTMSETEKWLNIVVDANVALLPYWPIIVSHYLQKIVRSFCGDSHEQENNSAYELGLVLHTKLKCGYYIQCINWTNDMEYFLSCLPNLVFNGNDSTDSMTIEGLVKALMMFPMPPINKGQRHCVMVAMNEPLPRRTLLPVPVPVIQDGQLLGAQVKPQMVDIFKVVEMFPQLEISLSIITPTELPIFNVIFVLGNKTTKAEENDSCSKKKIGEFTFFLSENFKEAYNVIHGNTSVEVPNISTSHIPAAMRTTIGEQTIEAAKAVRPESEVVVPSVTPKTHHASSSGANTSKKAYDDMISELYADDEVILLPTKKSRSSAPLEVFSFEDLLQPNNCTSTNPEQGTSKNRTSINLLDLSINSPSSTQVAPSMNSPFSSTGKSDSSDRVVAKAATGLSPKGPQEMQGEVYKTEGCVISTGVAIRLGLDPSKTHQQTSSPSSFFSPDSTETTMIQHFDSACTKSSDHNAKGNSPSIQVEASSFEPQKELLDANAAKISSTHNASCPHRAPEGSSVIRIQPGSSASPQMFPLHPHVSSSCAGGSSQSLQRMTEICDPRSYLPNLSSSVDFNEYVQAWEGSIGSIYVHIKTLCKAKAFRIETSPLTITADWETKLFICNYIPQKAFDYTKGLMKSEPISMLFYITESNDLALYNHLVKNKLHAKIDLRSQYLILSPTENSLFYQGSVFPPETLFKEPVEPKP